MVGANVLDLTGGLGADTYQRYFAIGGWAKVALSDPSDVNLVVRSVFEKLVLILWRGSAFPWYCNQANSLSRAMQHVKTGRVTAMLARGAIHAVTLKLQARVEGIAEGLGACRVLPFTVTTHAMMLCYLAECTVEHEVLHTKSDESPTRVRYNNWKYGCYVMYVMYSFAVYWALLVGQRCHPDGLMSSSALFSFGWHAQGLQC